MLLPGSSAASVAQTLYLGAFMPVRGVVTIFLSVLTLSTSASLRLFGQADVAPATDSAAAVRYAHAAEADPLTQTARLQRKEAMTFMENDHQTHVLLCQQIFNEMNNNHASNAHEITMQYLISAGGYLYAHPEAVSDSKAQNLAGLNAALNVYDKFLAVDPKTHAKFLDSLEKERVKGDLDKRLAEICK
jgi:hypothetical protein